MKIIRYFFRGYSAIITIVLILVMIGIGIGIYYYFQNAVQIKVLEKIISRLQADSRIAEVIVTNIEHDAETNKTLTTIKFLEYDTQGIPLQPQYFTFSGNVIQFQSLVIRFRDTFVKGGHALKGKSAYLFWKAFYLKGSQTEEFEITKVRQIPEGYKLTVEQNPYEETLWNTFWEYALDPIKAKKVGIKNVQIEAPGTIFVPGILYTLRIEHDGGIRIDTEPLPEILAGETILKNKNMTNILSRENPAE